MATGPENRKKLRQYAKLLAQRAEELSRMAQGLLAIEQDLQKRPAIRRAPTKRESVSAQTKREVVAMWRANPKMLQDEIGAHFNIDGGRVSEILAGKRPREGEESKRPRSQMDFEL